MVARPGGELEGRPAPGGVPRLARWLLGLGLSTAAVALLVLRVKVLRQFHAPAGDGLQYFQLARELREHHRLAFGPLPRPLEYARLPGYPVFIALLGRPTDMDPHLVRAALLNQALDLLSAGLVLLICIERRLGPLVGGLAAVMVLCCPILLYLSCYGLTESLCTFLMTAELYLAVRAMRDGSLGFAAGSGVMAGLAQLVRPDAVSLVPAVVCALALAAAPWRQRLRCVAGFGVAAAVVFSPWPIRNVLRFGAPHPTGAAAWQSQSGSELPTGMLTWLRTWCRGADGESFLMLRIANRRPLDMPRTLLPAMYDNDEEKQRVVAAFDLYNQHRSLAEADGAFRALAADRARRTPLRTYLGLPARRVLAEWSPIPEWELPMRSATLHLPERRRALARFERDLFALALLGAVWLLRFDRRLALVVALALVVRSLLFAFGIPFPVERYMAEAVPALLLCSAAAAAWLSPATWRRLRGDGAGGALGTARP